MRRPLLLFLFAQSFVIVLLYCLDPFGLGRILGASKGLTNECDNVVGICGTVTRVQVKDSYSAVTVDVGGEKTLIRFAVSGQDLMIYDLVGREISATGELSLPDGRRNPGCFDYSLYLKGRRVYTIMDVSRYRLEAGPVKKPLLHWISVKKGEFFEAVRPYMDERSFSLMTGLLFGETSYMDEDLYEQFRLNGISHVLAVSGLHVGLLYSLVMKLLGGRRGTGTTVVTVLLLFIYAALSNFSISVLRASFMIVLNLFSFHLRRRYDLVSAATFCAIVFMFINPYHLFDTGFQLSFAAAYSMGIALPWAVSMGTKLSDKYKKRWILTLFEIFSPCVMVQLGMAPLILFHYLSFSPVSLLLNPLAVGLAGMLLPAGLACFVLSLFTKGLLLAGGAGIAQGFAKLMLLLSSAGEYVGGGFYTAAPPFSTLVIYYLFFFWFFSETRVVLRRRGRHGALLALNLTLIAAGTVMPWAFGLSENILPWKYDTHSVTFLDVGQGDCTHVNIGGYNILIDGGGNYFNNIAEKRLRPYLLKNGITHIDLALVTHLDTDHALGIYQLADIFDIREIRVLGADNDDCGICMIDADGIRVLLMADADIARENALCETAGDALHCDILKVGHHGSAGSTGETLLRCAAPRFALISCGKNNIYGHPAPRVVELLSNSGIIYGRTDESGAIYLKDVLPDSLVFENAAKDRQWHIQRDNPIQNTPQGP